MALFDRLFRRGPPHGEHEATFARAIARLQSLTALHEATWKLGAANWSADLDAGHIRFTLPDKREIIADVQVIGTFNTADGTWLWGWDHPSVPAPCATHAAAVRTYGEAHNIPALVTRKLPLTEDGAWSFTALACLLADAQGAYRGQSGSARVFMTFGPLTMRPGPDTPPPGDTDWGRGLPLVDAPDVIAFVRDYEAALFEQDVAYHAKREGDEQAFKRALAANRLAYDRFWRRDDDYHEPICTGWPSDHDPATHSGWRVYRLSDDTWRVAFERFIGITLHSCYDVRRFPDGLRIIDFPLRD